MDPWEVHQIDVEKVFKFSAADLAENLEGRITPTQLARARSWRWHMIKSRGSVAAVLLVLAIIGAIFFIRRTGEFLILLGALSLIALIIGGFSVAMQDLRHRRAIRAAKVKSVTGPSDLELLKTRYGPFFLLHIGDREFTLSEVQHSTLWDGQAYTIHYLAGTGLILSVKAIPETLKTAEEAAASLVPSGDGSTC